MTRQGKKQRKSLIGASIKNGVSHFKFSTADRDGVQANIEPTNVPHFITKSHAEQHLFAQTKEGHMTWTVLRSVAFFDNLFYGPFGKSVYDQLVVEITGGADLTSDICVFAAKAFLDPGSDQYRNACNSLAGDELTFVEFRNDFEEKISETSFTTYWFFARLINRVLNEDANPNIIDLQNWKLMEKSMTKTQVDLGPWVWAHIMLTLQKNQDQKGKLL